MARGHMHLGLFAAGTGHHVAAWRLPEIAPGSDTDIDYFIDLAQTAERGLFDLFFLADSSAMRGSKDLENLSRTARGSALDPYLTLSALAVKTGRIGLIATATTSYTEPYYMARQLASLDHISHGRAGWNLVTSNNEDEALNFSREAHYAHADRYARAREYIDVVRGLWDSWDDDAFLGNKASGRNFDPGKLHLLNHRGDHFQVRGPLTVARPPQGHPVVVQAGSSETGRDLAAQTAEVVFTAQQTLEGAKAFYADLKGRLTAFGRSADDLKIMPGFAPIIGRTRAEAQDKFEELQGLVQPEVGLSMLSTTLGGADLSGYDLDAPMPDLPETNGPKSRQRLILDAAKRDGLTLRQVYLRVVLARGHFSTHGTAADIADVLEQWFTEKAADGFNVMPQALPSGIRDFVDLVVPELQRRGLFRTGYDGKTLRDHLGLSRRPSQYRAAS